RQLYNPVQWTKSVEFIAAASVSHFTSTLFTTGTVGVKCETDAAAIRDALVRQLYNPVQWTKSVEFIAAQGVNIFMK
ncbi:hypothetical protein L245_04420, partial [Salmonella enterica subsp. enterica serovar Worthington str. BCH-4719]